MDYNALAKIILNCIGGEANVISFTHCATRLRFNLHDETLADTERLKKTKGVMGVVSSGGQYQVVIGSDVPNVYRELNIIGNFDKSSNSNSKNDDKNAFVRVLDTVAGIFTPIIPAITGAGILKAVMALLTAFKLIDTASQTYYILSVFADAAFYFLPFLLAYSTAKKFNCSIVVAMSIAGILLHPNFTALISSGQEVRFIYIPVISATYSSSVIPIILSIWFMSFVEPIADKISPKSVKFFTKPLITLVVTGAAAIWILGPIGTIVGDGIAAGIEFLNRYARWLVPTLLGVFSPFLVMTGTHYGLIPIGINNIATAGLDTIVGPGMLGSNIAQGGAAFAVSLKTKNKEFKQQAASAGITAVCGITEPAMYGVNLKLKKPLIPVMIAGGVSGLFMGIMSVGRYTTGSPGLLALPGYIGTDGFANILYAIAGCIIAFVIGFAGTYILGFDDVENDEAASVDASSSEICAPIKGNVIPLSEVNDLTFAEEILGKGAAIVPETNLLVSPVNGKVINLTDTMHAVAIMSEDGAEVLMHIGMDTVNLNGKYFKTYVSEGDDVKMGDPLIEFDTESIKKEGYDLTTPVVITNSDDYMEVRVITKFAVEQKPFIKLTVKE